MVLLMKTFRRYDTTKIRFKNKGSPCYFLSSRGQKMKNITKIKHHTVFVYILGFICYDVSRAKTDSHNK